MRVAEILVYALGAEGRRFESSRPDHPTEVTRQSLGEATSGVSTQGIGADPDPSARSSAG